MKKKILFIGASAGGPSLIKELLKSITTLGCSVVIAQHMKEEVLPLFINDLAENVSIDLVATPIKIDFSLPSVIVCSSSTIIRKEASSYIFERDSTNQCYTPDINKLLNSFVPYASEFEISIFIMTGIGCDGVDGAKNLKELGAKVYVQDEESSPVYGMPKAALESGIADGILTFSEFKNYIQSF